jgi:hypothetical protein
MKLTSKLLKKIIEEEVGKFGDMEDPEKRAKDTDEVDADEYADALEKKIDYAKALKVEELRLRARLNKIVETRARVMKSIRKGV